MGRQYWERLTAKKGDSTDMADFDFPAHVDDLEAVPEQWRGLYEASDSQNFTLTAKAAEALNAVEVAAEAKLAAAHAERDARILAQDASIASGKKQLQDLVGARAIRERMVERGVPFGLTTAAIATFRAHYSLEVEKRADGEFHVQIADSFGKVSVAEAVDTWLDRDEAAKVFRPPPPTREGELTRALRAMRDRVH